MAEEGGELNEYLIEKYQLFLYALSVALEIALEIERSRVFRSWPRKAPEDKSEFADKGGNNTTFITPFFQHLPD